MPFYIVYIISALINLFFLLVPFGKFVKKDLATGEIDLTHICIIVFMPGLNTLLAIYMIFVMTCEMFGSKND